MKKLLLSKNKVALIDDEDFERANKHKWSATKDARCNLWYAVRAIKKRGKWTTEKLHRFIMDVSRGMLIDHKNHDGLDNRKNNLRLCTVSENLQNARPQRKTSGFKGVYLDRGRWRAVIKAKGKQLYLGYFNNETDAAKAYDKAARLYFGSFALVNLEASK